MTARLLIVDDEAQVRWSLRERLNAAGYDVVESGLASEAIERILAADFHLVLIDFQLPDNDIFAVLDRIKSLAPDTLVIVAVTAETRHRVGDAIKAGVHDYVTKPLDVDEVVLRVERALEVRQLRRELQQLRDAQWSAAGPPATRSGDS